MSSDEKGRSILVVDDTLDNLRVLSGMLGARGFDVRPVTSGHEALRVVAHEPPDLVLLDVMMPEMTGFEVCEKLRANPDSANIPIIFLTALSDVSDKVKGFAVGGTDYITKPFQFDEVLARVENQLALRQARRELADSLERLRGLEQLRDDLVHMVVHDMRSPLTVLIGRLQQLQPHVAGAQQKALDAATRSAVALNRMADTLLDVSRLEEGKMPVDRTMCDLSALAAEVRNAVLALDAKRVIDLDSPGSVTTLCDASLVRRVIENLVGNAVKHTPSEGRLRIGVRARPGQARIEVQDEGDGVPPEARERIFEKFGTLATRKDESYHSAGLGLAFCRLAVQAHGGTIGVDGVEPHGSLFWVELPA
jgi:two-component system sensor histidine kinase/response regulator